MTLSNINNLTDFNISRDLDSESWNVNLNERHFCDIDKNDRGKFETFNMPSSVTANQFSDINIILDAFNKL